MTKTVVCFGELLLRLGAPGREFLLQSPRLDVHFGGAEANVAVSLARLGHKVAMASIVPDNALGHACTGELRRHGVDTAAVLTGPGRMGLYFLVSGAIHRPGEVLYDRAHSAFALAAADAMDWDLALADADHLHLSGVTPALGPVPAQAALRAAKAARARGLRVSFDSNYRSKLWEAWDSDPAAILAGLIDCADIVFADHRDIEVVLGRRFESAPAEQLPVLAAQAALEAFPRLERIATTQRVQRNVDHHELAAVMVTRKGVTTAPAQGIAPIVDRIGAGDAFAAGILHGLRTGMGDDDTLRFGLAAACLKHSIPGDFNLAAAADVAALVAERGFDVRR